MSKTALVLSGGGARGAYQVGAWKALHKLHIKIDIVTGTSIGALNGVFVVQNDLKKCYSMWSNIDYSQIYGHKFNFEKDAKVHDIYYQYLHTLIKEGSIDTTCLDHYFAAQVNPKKFFKSPINYGLITFNLSTLKPLIITKDKLTPKNLIDYALASAACYPAFKIKKIDDNSFIDGGYYDVTPINLAIDLGADSIIAIDVQALGIRKPISNKSIKVIKIAPRNKIVDFLIFDKELSKEALLYGYNDTMKTYNKLDGNKFTFQKNHLRLNYKHLIPHYRQYLENIMQNIEKKNIISGITADIIGIKKYITKKDTNKEFNKIVEYLGSTFNLKEFPIYSIRKYNDQLKNKINNITDISITSIEEKIRNGKIKSIIDSKIVIKYLYNQIKKIETKTQAQALMTIACLFKKEFLAAVYLLSIDHKIKAIK